MADAVQDVGERLALGVVVERPRGGQRERAEPNLGGERGVEARAVEAVVVAPGGDEEAIAEGVAQRPEERRGRLRAAHVDRDHGDEPRCRGRDAFDEDAGGALLVIGVGGREQRAQVCVAVVVDGEERDRIPRARR